MQSIGSNLRSRKSKFQLKIEKFYKANENKSKYNDDLSYKNHYVKLKSRKRRRIFVKLLTSRLTKLDLKDKGFKFNNDDCRICSMNGIHGNKENLMHILTFHGRGVKRKNLTNPSNILKNMNESHVSEIIEELTVVGSSPKRKKVNK